MKIKEETQWIGIEKAEVMKTIELITCKIGTVTKMTNAQQWQKNRPTSKITYTW